MKSTFFAILSVFAAVVLASPAAQLQSRTSCGNNQFYYKQRGCCLDNGGPRVVPAAPTGRDCPSNWYWHHVQGCCTPRNQPRDNDPQPSCQRNGWNWNRAIQCCENNTPTPTGNDHPQNSPKPDCDDDKKDGNKNGHKRSIGANAVAAMAAAHKKRSKKSRDVSVCPYGFEACPVSALSTNSGDIECIAPMEDITSCGGCVTLGQGQDCTAIPNTWNVACDMGSCSILSCQAGFQRSADGKSCVSL